MPPQCHCETPIWHPDIANLLDHDTPNNVCVSYLKRLGSVHGNAGYSVGMGMAAVITGCCLLFHEQQYEGIGCLTPFDALNNDAVNFYVSF